MNKWTVKFFNEAKWFWFISEDGTSNEYFVHTSGVVGGEIQEGDKVEFDLAEWKKGLNAVDVKLV